MNVVYILWLRQIKKYFRTKSRVIGSLGQPLLFLVAFGYGFGSIYAKADGGNYIQFLVPGIICISVLFTAIFSGMDLIWDKQFGFLKESLVAPVPRLNIILGQTLGGATVATLQGVFVFLLTLLLGFTPQSYLSLLEGLIIVFLISLLFTSLGVAIATNIDDMQGFQLIMNFMIMPMVLLSGSFYPLKDIPFIIALISKLNPLSYGIDALRGTLIGLYAFNPFLDIVILASITLTLLLIGSYLFEKIQA